MEQFKSIKELNDYLEKTFVPDAEGNVSIPADQLKTLLRNNYIMHTDILTCVKNVNNLTAAFTANGKLDLGKVGKLIGKLTFTPEEKQADLFKDIINLAELSDIIARYGNINTSAGETPKSITSGANPEQ